MVIEIYPFAKVTRNLKLDNNIKVFLTPAAFLIKCAHFEILLLQMSDHGCKNMIKS